MAEANEFASPPLIALIICRFLSYLVLVIFCSLYLSIIKTQWLVLMDQQQVDNYLLLNLLIMIAFSVHKSSAGNALANHLSLSSALDKY